MHRLGRRIRAAVAMGLTWALAWSLAGAVLARVPGFSSDLPFALLFAPLGFVSGVVFAGILVGIERRRGLAGASLPRFAGWGAASGLLLTAVIVGGAAVRGGDVWGELLLFGPPLVVASAVCAAGSLAVARRGERRELAGGRGPAAAELPAAEERASPVRDADRRSVR